ncbi:hypothetical protein QR680_016675 [Steinernema hermaphroditum]|uniref:Uncharacterized protein n=1 Tax=Steinernema hermaphroditum TaxID=289476 RepID=A0AA39LMY5_9BILA|nr:hypothetical protein QR680_016675 [Steinernema hermaphroditum]
MEFTRRSVIGVVLVLFALYVLLFIWSFTTLYELAENKALLVGDTLGKLVEGGEAPNEENNGEDEEDQQRGSDRVSQSHVLHMDPSLQTSATSSVLHRIGGTDVVLCMPTNINRASSPLVIGGRLRLLVTCTK